MIDIEDAVIDRLEPKLQAVFGGDFYVFTDENIARAETRCGFLQEIDNTAESRTADSGCNENHAVITLRWSVYLEKQRGKKMDCKAIFNLGDEILTGMGFARVGKMPVQMDSPAKFRIDGRYRATVSKDKTIIGGIYLGEQHV